MMCRQLEILISSSARGREKTERVLNSEPNVRMTARGCRLKASGRSIDPADWFDLDDALERDICAAVRTGAAVVDVLRARQVSRGTYYHWLHIGRGKVTHWWDGCPIDDQVRDRCWRLAVRVAEARVEHDRTYLEHLRALGGPHKNGVPCDHPSASDLMEAPYLMDDSEKRHVRA
jgi:hypothetical protein